MSLAFLCDLARRKCVFLMKRIIAHLGLIVLFITSADAMWVELPEKELLDSSQLIVSATLQDNMTLTAQNSSLGVLRIIRVYHGLANSEQVYIKLPSRGFPISSSDLVYTAGQKGIWFLQETELDSGIFYLDHPQRLWSIEREAILLDLLKRRTTFRKEIK